jgi:hypothetical protein
LLSLNSDDDHIAFVLLVSVHPSIHLPTQHSQPRHIPRHVRLFTFRQMPIIMTSEVNNAAALTHFSFSKRAPDDELRVHDSLGFATAWQAIDQLDGLEQKRIESTGPLGAEWYRMPI